MSSTMSASQRVRTLIAASVLMSVLGFFALNEARAEQTSGTCEGATCVLQTSWWTVSDGFGGYIYQDSAYTSTSEPFWANLTYLRNYSNSGCGPSCEHLAGNPFSADYAGCGNAYYCGTSALDNCTTTPPTSGCGSTTNLWWGTTKHELFRYSTSPGTAYYTSSDGTRSNVICYGGNFTCIH